MQPYASQTNTGRNIRALRRAGWRFLLNPVGKNSGGWNPHGLDYAIDNGAWSAFANDEPWDKEPFEELCEKRGDGADFIVVPDVVGQAKATLENANIWLPILDGIGHRRLIAVQDGMVPDDIRAWLSADVGIFVGGTTDWKLESLPMWGVLAASVDCYLHVGRVNTVRRIAMCQDAGADSFDGTSATRYAVNLRRLDGAARQMHMFQPQKETT